MGDEPHDRVSEWEDGLPNGDDLTPLSQLLISSELSSAFNITPQPYPTMIDVNQASNNTFENLQTQSESPLTRFGSSKEGKRTADPDSTETENDDQRVSKRQRLVWTPQLHKRFVEVVGHLGVKNAVPKTIMELMNVEGLSRENVASHLQKYRMYLKRTTTYRL